MDCEGCLNPPDDSSPLPGWTPWYYQHLTLLCLSRWSRWRTVPAPAVTIPYEPPKLFQVPMLLVVTPVLPPPPPSANMPLPFLTGTLQPHFHLFIIMSL